MDLSDPATLGLFVGGVLAALGGREGIGWWLRKGKKPEAKRHPSGEHPKPNESVVSKAEAKTAVDAAVAVEQRLGGIERGIATLTTEVQGGFKRVEQRQDDHSKLDDERFRELREDLRITRRQLGMDSQVLDVRGR